MEFSMEDQKKSILLQLSPIFVQEGNAAEYVRNTLGLSNNKERLYLEEGNHHTPAIALFSSSWDELNKLLADQGRRIEDDPILRELAKMDGKAGLSREELAAGLLAAESMPRVVSALGMTALELPTGKHYALDKNGQATLNDHKRSDPATAAFVTGMGVDMDERSLAVAVTHMKEYLATARQFLGDNYNVPVFDEHGHQQDTRSPESDKEYANLMRESFKAIRQTVGEVRDSKPKGRGF